MFFDVQKEVGDIMAYFVTNIHIPPAPIKNPENPSAWTVTGRTEPGPVAGVLGKIT